MAEILIPVSTGELIDKITILRIKTRSITDPQKIESIQKELNALLNKCAEHQLDLTHPSVSKLEAVNQKLWDIEDQIRDQERAKKFDEKFIELARAVYMTNDERFRLKSEVNLAFGSEFREEKSYKGY